MRVVAARKYLGNTSRKRDGVTVGHSQGGHAALGAAQYASRAQLDYKGTIAIAPASNLACYWRMVNKSGSSARCRKENYIPLCH